MSVIIRLQNLPWSANATDIRQYFQGLGIPEGGVHIVGGELGDAFIAFSTDEDARQAFNLSNGKIKGVQIKLMLSSRTEMQKVIENARNQSLSAFMQAPPRLSPPAAVVPILPSAVPSSVPEIKRSDERPRDDFKSKSDGASEGKSKEKRRSRSRSRDRKDRDRRDRRRRERTRSRSRERRERRRRDDRNRDHNKGKDRDYHRAGRSHDRSPQREAQVVWEAPPPELQLQQQSAATLLGAIPSLLAATAAKSLLEQSSFQAPLHENFGSVWSNPNALHEPTFQPPDRFPREDRFGYNRNRHPFESRGSSLDSRPSLFPPLNRFNVDNRGTSEKMINPKNCCVQLHPFMGGFGEVRRFFQGIFIHSTGIKFVNDEYGKRTGTVYIKFALPEGKKEALLRSGTLLRNQTVTITHLDDEIFDEAVDRYHPNSDEEDYNPPDSVFDGQKEPFTVLVVEDLPSYAKEQDLLKIFSDYSLTSIILLNKPRKITLAYIKFSNANDAKAALEAKAKHSVDGKAVAVKPCSDKEFEAVQREQGTFMEEPTKPNNEAFQNSDVLLLSRLPLKTTDRDITDFFSDIGITPTNIHMLTNALGFVGDAYCEFDSVKSAQAAFEKHGAPLGTAIVSVKSVPRVEMEEALNVPNPDEDIDENLENDPFERLNQNDDESNPVVENNHTPRLGSALASRFNAFQNSLDFQPPVKLGEFGFRPRLPAMRPMMGMNPLRPFQPRNSFMMPGHRGANFMGPRPRRFPPPPPPMFQQPPHMNGGAEDVFPPGCTVLMENVPFKATVDEILNFFSGYEISPDNILRRYTPNGKPSGESKVIFKNPDDAYQAVHEKQEQKIRDRTVYLTLC